MKLDINKQEAEILLEVLRAETTVVHGNRAETERVVDKLCGDLEQLLKAKVALEAMRLEKKSD